MSAFPLPCLARWILAATAPPALRGPIIGDLTEEFARRRGIDSRQADRWLARQVLGSAGACLRFRLGRSVTPTVAAGVLAGAGLVALLFALLNTETALAVVGGMPSPARGTVAVAANLVVMVLAGALTASIGRRRSSAALVGLMAVSTVLLRAMAGPAPELPLAARAGWIALGSAAAWLGIVALPAAGAFGVARDEAAGSS